MEKKGALELPEDLLRVVIGYLSARDIASCQAAGSDVRKYAEDKQLWRQLCESDLSLVLPPPSEDSSNLTQFYRDTYVAACIWVAAGARMPLPRA